MPLSRAALTKFDRYRKLLSEYDNIPLLTTIPHLWIWNKVEKGAMRNYNYMEGSQTNPEQPQCCYSMRENQRVQHVWLADLSKDLI